MHKPITIVGGGLAGLTLGIQLRQRNVPVRIWEAGQYPRHRVCGEFISGRGQASLARAGLLDRLRDLGACEAREVAFFSPGGRSWKRELPEPALCLSRYHLDAFLAEHFRSLEGELSEDRRWNGAEYPEGTVRASGRQASAGENGWHWFGVKAHTRDIELSADLEMHLRPDGYVGIGRVENGLINVCALLRRRRNDPAERADWTTRMAGPPGTTLHGRLGHAKFEAGSFCAVGGLNLQPQKAKASDECRIGDALTMIPPLTGNGMSIAFESAEIAADALVDFSKGGSSWEEARRKIAFDCDRRFGPRLFAAGRMQGAMFWPPSARLLFQLARVPLMWAMLFRATR